MRFRPGWPNLWRWPAPRYSSLRLFAFDSSCKRRSGSPSGRKGDGREQRTGAALDAAFRLTCLAPPVTVLPRLDRFSRIVVKVGSSLLVDPARGALRQDWLDALVDDLAGLHKRGADVLVVSSGAIALGRSVLEVPFEVPQGIAIVPAASVIRPSCTSAAARWGRT